MVFCSCLYTVWSDQILVHSSFLHLVWKVAFTSQKDKGLNNTLVSEQNIFVEPLEENLIIHLMFELFETSKDEKHALYGGGTWNRGEKNWSLSIYSSHFFLELFTEPAPSTNSRHFFNSWNGQFYFQCIVVSVEKYYPFTCLKFCFCAQKLKFLKCHYKCY